MVKGQICVPLTRLRSADGVGWCPLVSSNDTTFPKQADLPAGELWTGRRQGLQSKKEPLAGECRQSGTMLLPIEKKETATNFLANNNLKKFIASMRDLGSRCLEKLTSRKLGGRTLRQAVKGWTRNRDKLSIEASQPARKQEVTKNPFLLFAFFTKLLDCDLTACVRAPHCGFQSHLTHTTCFVHVS